jgi:hypothetical protein
MVISKSNVKAAKQRSLGENSANSRVKNRIGGWESTPSGLKHGTIEILSSGGNERIKVSSKIQKISATLDEDLTSGETDVDVTDATQVTKGDIIRIDLEDMLIRSISSDTLTVRRGVNGTTAATHTEEAEILVLNPKKPTRFTELSSDSLTFNRDGSTFNYPKQMQFIPASALTFGSAFTFSPNFASYDDDQYDVLFILKDMQTYSVEASDEGSAQSLQLFASNKTGLGFTPTANIFVGSVLSSSTVTSFDDSGAVFGGTPLATPSNSTAKTSNDAFDDQATAGVVSLSITFTLTYSSVVDKDDDMIVEGFIRAGTSDGSNAFSATNYEQLAFSDTRETGFGAGTRTKTKSFTFGGALGNPARVVLTITDFNVTGSSSASIAAAITSITYTTSSGTTRSITGANKADAIVIAR